MLSSILVACLSVLPLAQVDVAAECLRLHAAGDRDGLAALWRAHPGDVLVTIDADLEAGLAIWEQAPTRADPAVAAHHARALWAAEVASEATGQPIFVEYAAAFTGWSAEEKGRFRAGQRAFGRSRQALAAGDGEAALTAARECRDLALPLGDWWGAAMGLQMEAQALLALDRDGEAVAPLGVARRIYGELQLLPSEYGTLRTLAETLANLEQWSRVRVAAQQALALARTLGDGPGERVLLGRRREAELALGLTAAAEATAAELTALGDG